MAQTAAAAESNSTEKDAAKPNPEIFNVRIRPLALFQEIVGAEFGIAPTPRFETGPTVHWFDEPNDVRGSEVNSWELGLKATGIVWSPFYREGAYLSGAAYYYITQVSQSFASPPATITTSHFHTLGWTLTAGYQWNLRLFNTDAWTVRLGGGVGYKQEHLESVMVQGQAYPLGVRTRLDPTMEFTVGVAI